MALLESTGSLAQKAVGKLARSIVCARSLTELHLVDVNLNEVSYTKHTYTRVHI